MQATHNIDDVNAALSIAAEDAQDAYLPRVAHPFQRAGLGRAPFTCTGVDDAGARGEKCSFCSTSIRYVYHIQGADGSRFQVGSECVKQTGGEVAGFAQFNRQMTARIAALRSAAKTARVSAAWTAEHPGEVAYIEKRVAAGSSFYKSLADGLAKYGNLSEGRLRCVRDDMARDERLVLNVAGTQTGRISSGATHLDESNTPKAAPVVNLQAVEAAFASATAAGIQYPKLRLGDFVFSPAGASSANPGAIYVKERKPSGELPGAYLGKVLRGSFFRGRDCTDEAEAAIVDISKDPAAAAVAYGHKFGRCSVCNRELSDAESVARGIGPICAEKYGF